MKKHIEIILIITLSLLLISCDSTITYDEIENINKISISKGDNFKEDVENFDISITEQDLLNRVASFINSAEKYHRKNVNNILYNDYLVELNYNDNLTSRMLFFFPQDKDSQVGCFFYYVGYEDNIFSISPEDTDELIKLFFSYGDIPKINRIILISKENFENNNTESYIYIDDEEKVNYFEDIIESSKLEENLDRKDYIDYIIDLEYEDPNQRTNPFIFSIPTNNKPVSFYQIGYEDLVYLIDDDKSETIKSILFER